MKPVNAVVQLFSVCLFVRMEDIEFVYRSMQQDGNVERKDTHTHYRTETGMWNAPTGETQRQKGLGMICECKCVDCVVCKQSDDDGGGTGNG